MTLRMGMGRDEEVRVSVTETVYAGAEEWLKQRIGDRPFALSLEIIEINSRFSQKRFNTIHGFLKNAEPDSG